MSELTAIQQLVADYFTGLHHGQLDRIENVFHPQAQINGYYEGELVMIKLPEYLTVLRRMSAPSMLGEEFDMQLAAIHLTPSSASVETRYLFQALRYVDYLSLLKVDGCWKILNKTFYHQPD